MADLTLAGSLKITVNNPDVDFVRMRNVFCGQEKEEGFKVAAVGSEGVIGKAFFGEQVEVELLTQSIKEFGEYGFFFGQSQGCLLD